MNIKSFFAALAWVFAAQAQAVQYDVITTHGVDKKEWSEAIAQSSTFSVNEQVNAFVTISDLDEHQDYPQTLEARWYHCGNMYSQRALKSDAIKTHLKRDVHHMWFWIKSQPSIVGSNRVDIYADGTLVTSKAFDITGNDGKTASCGMTSAADYTLSGDALFHFGKFQADEMYNNGKEQIAVIAQKIAKDYQSYDVIRVVGHTDYLGSEAYNQALSQKRAQTVKNILVASGLSANRIVVEGAGESQPVKQCSSTLSEYALKECLKDNRRIEFFVQGVKR
ncbi:MAG: outer membrane protein OmpA [Burkholderiaceae bacterium]|nr:outer membrane protein OmpA [Burkholderiaceae bacterium]